MDHPASYPFGREPPRIEIGGESAQGVDRTAPQNRIRQSIGAGQLSSLGSGEVARVNVARRGGSRTAGGLTFAEVQQHR
jgi:hypothetical protein